MSWMRMTHLTVVVVTHVSSVAVTYVIGVRMTPKTHDRDSRVALQCVHCKHVQSPHSRYHPGRQPTHTQQAPRPAAGSPPALPRLRHPPDADASASSAACARLFVAAGAYLPMLHRHRHGRGTPSLARHYLPPLARNTKKLRPRGKRTCSPFLREACYQSEYPEV